MRPSARSARWPCEPSERVWLSGSGALLAVARPFAGRDRFLVGRGLGERGGERAHVGPGGALLGGLAQQVGGMQHGDRRNRSAVATFVVEPGAPNAGDAGADAEQGLGGQGAEADENLGRQVRSAGG